MENINNLLDTLCENSMLSVMWHKMNTNNRNDTWCWCYTISTHSLTHTLSFYNFNAKRKVNNTVSFLLFIFFILFETKYTIFENDKLHTKTHYDTQYTMALSVIFFFSPNSLFCSIPFVPHNEQEYTFICMCFVCKCICHSHCIASNGNVFIYLHLYILHIIKCTISHFSM